MSSLLEPRNLGDLLKYEAPNFYSRDVVTVATGQTLALGAAVGRKTADGKHYAIDPQATDGTEVAVGVLANDVDASTGDRTDAILIARHAIVARSALVWPTGTTTAERTQAESELVAAGVIVRQAA